MRHQATTTRTASGSLAEAVEAALIAAPRHHAVVAFDLVYAGRRCWRVEIIAQHVVREYVRGLEEDLAAAGFEGTVDVWEQHEDVILDECRAAVRQDLQKLLS